MIKVLKPGIEATVQDNGRIGYYELGMPPSGAMDKFSYSVGNWLVGNQDGAASLEATYMGPALEFQEDATIALTGGELPPKVNGKSVSMWETLKVKSGDILSFDFVKNGARIYLSVAGGINVPEIMGSRSTYTLCGIGGFEGRSLKEGDTLHIGNDQQDDVKEGTKVSSEFVPQYTKQHEIRVVVGLCSYRLTEHSLQNFLKTEWTVTPEANRVGYRFKGEKVEFIPREQPFGAGSDPSNVVDLGYPVGSIQIPGGVEPIALLNDAVTGGGYVTVATITSTDLNRIAQTKTNEKVKFESVTLNQALEERNAHRSNLSKIKDSIQQQQ
ncbi:biotin-dependent carboxyltransferase family protein [Lentibacillus sp. L22]|uniref:5-oxoprolinase subunit C family protein n=1 Tax=Lentibacillus TaxID=175304 RepID=UPI0022B1E41D|nr:biotin-dependent carboxyltransferase family protein [Lentibacillus daqui]